jgi:hypothetical protein
MYWRGIGGVLAAYWHGGKIVKRASLSAFALLLIFTGPSAFAFSGGSNSGGSGSRGSGGSGSGGSGGSGGASGSSSDSSSGKDDDPPETEEEKREREQRLAELAEQQRRRREAETRKPETEAERKAREKRLAELAEEQKKQREAEKQREAAKKAQKQKKDDEDYKIIVPQRVRNEAVRWLAQDGTAQPSLLLRATMQALRRQLTARGQDEQSLTDAALLAHLLRNL